MRTCDGCRFCCFAWAVDDPILKKPALTHCRHECALGCFIHPGVGYPSTCRLFTCQYLEGADIHRPDAFQSTLEKAGGNIGNFIPFVHLSISIDEANKLITETRTIPASVIINGQWVHCIMPLDRARDSNWETLPAGAWGDLGFITHDE